MKNINMYDIDSIQNLNEKRVWAMVPEFLERNQNYCTCKSCVMDYVALTLNSVPPCYQVNDVSIDAAREKVTDPELYRAMLQAAEKVRKNPHHLD